MADGFLSLPGFMTAAEVAEVNAGVQRFIEAVVPAMPAELVYYEDRGDPATLKQVQLLHEHDPYFRSLMSGSRFQALARALLGEDVVGRNLQYFNKPPGIGLPTPPHQDGRFFMLEPCTALTMWLALEDVGEAQGCIRYVRGSHTMGMRVHERSGVLGFSQHIPGFGREEDLEREVVCPSTAGQLLVHHALTIHRASGNRSPDRSRRALGFIYHARSARHDEAAHAAYQNRLATELAAQRKI
ncbi:MAG: phytanoyl-CoA dioxygenase [Planctomycetes bacterium]|nr:phytanoyl-CoA dioxygenase [Planctomycetota bacterium]